MIFNAENDPDSQTSLRGILFMCRFPSFAAGWKGRKRPLRMQHYLRPSSHLRCIFPPLHPPTPSPPIAPIGKMDTLHINRGRVKTSAKPESYRMWNVLTPDKNSSHPHQRGPWTACVLCVTNGAYLKQVKHRIGPRRDIIHRVCFSLLRLNATWRGIEILGAQIDFILNSALYLLLPFWGHGENGSDNSKCPLYGDPSFDGHIVTN